MKTTIAELSIAIYQNAVNKGFYDKPETDDEYVERMCNNLHDEVSELHEAWRNGRLYALCDKASKMQLMGLVPLACLEEELADIMIRTMDNAMRLGVDLTMAVNTKMAYNESREYRHGNKKS